MDAKKLIGLGKELGLSGKALLQWVEKERERESEEYALRREAAKEDHERELERQAGERQLLELRLRMQELQQTSQVVPAEPSDRDASRQGLLEKWKARVLNIRPQVREVLLD
ncbi:hypothetical protein HPB50_026453 [Hyalomma asiaticum]|uniref:Uncharacterized protein n=1 Tax=Hyalomma asiaticum TaxID=266040 RepID=A0ACB7T1S0_HYAAI|nr:hypothetical protein HPB50_026453 [Hyalomma asiaticum]